MRLACLSAVYMCMLCEMRARGVCQCVIGTFGLRALAIDLMRTFVVAWMWRRLGWSRARGVWRVKETDNVQTGNMKTE